MGFVVKVTKRDDDQPLSPQSLFGIEARLVNIRRKSSSFRAVAAPIEILETSSRDPDRRGMFEQPFRLDLFTIYVTSTCTKF